MEWLNYCSLKLDAQVKIYLLFSPLCLNLSPVDKLMNQCLPKKQVLCHFPLNGRALSRKVVYFPTHSKVLFNMLKSRRQFHNLHSKRKAIDWLSLFKAHPFPTSHLTYPFYINPVLCFVVTIVYLPLWLLIRIVAMVTRSHQHIDFSVWKRWRTQKLEFQGIKSIYLLWLVYKLRRSTHKFNIKPINIQVVSKSPEITHRLKPNK